MMDKLTVGFSKPKKWKPFAWLIQKAFNISYDHVYIKIYSESYERDLIYQASGLAVNFMGSDVFDSINDTVVAFELEVSCENRKAMVQFAIDNAGKPYGLKEILGLAYVRIAELCGKTVKNPFKDGAHTYVCSELVSYMLQQYDGAVLPKDYEDMTPKDVYDYLMLLGNKIK
jgi:hypothetical protein